MGIKILFDLANYGQITPITQTPKYGPEELIPPCTYAGNW